MCTSVQNNMIFIYMCILYPQQNIDVIMHKSFEYSFRKKWKAFLGISSNLKISRIFIHRYIFILHPCISVQNNIIFLHMCIFYPQQTIDIIMHTNFEYSSRKSKSSFWVSHKYRCRPEKFWNSSHILILYKFDYI